MEREEQTPNRKLSCDEMQALFLDETGREQLAVQAHLSECSLCRALFGEAPSLPEPVDGAVRTAVLEQVRRPASVISRLRELPRAARLALCGVAACLPLAYAASRLRGDFDVYPMTRMTAALVLFGGATVAGLSVALRPLWRAPARWHRGLPPLLSILPFALALMPSVERHSGMGPVFAADDWGHHLACLGWGSAFAMAPILAFRVLDRLQGEALQHNLLAVLAGAALANAGLQLQCAGHGRVHLVLGHAGVVGSALLIWWLRRQWLRANSCA